MTHRFVDAGQRLDSFSHHFLVHCPRCDRCAQVARLDEGHALPVRLVCTACGYTKSYEHNYGIVGDMPVDWFFRLPLWLQTPCCGHTLWAYNYEHLDYVERYVRAELRTEEPYQNGSLASRLPAWLKSAKHRDDVLR